MALLVHLYWYCYLFFIHHLFCTMVLVLLLFIQKRNNGQLCQEVTLISTMFKKTKITLLKISNRTRTKVESEFNNFFFPFACKLNRTFAITCMEDHTIV